MEYSQPQRKKFKTTRDWNDFIGPLLQSGQGITGKDLFELRKACYQEIEAYRQKPLLIYATKFVEGVPPGAPNFIDLSDVDGFTDLINSIMNDGAIDDGTKGNKLAVFNYSHRGCDTRWHRARWRHLGRGLGIGRIASNVTNLFSDRGSYWRIGWGLPAGCVHAHSHRA